MDSYVSGLLWVLGAVAAGALIGYLIRYFGLNAGRSSTDDEDDDEAHENNNGAVGQVFVIVSGLHAVLVAFVLITLFDAVDSTRDGSYREAQSLVAASWAADSLPEPVPTEVNRLSTAYARTVAQQEWPRMRGGGEVTGPGWEQLNQLRVAIAQSAAEDDWQVDRKTEAANQLWQVYQERQNRLTVSNDRGVVAVVWLVLVIGTLATFILPNLFSGTRFVTHLVIVSTLAGVLMLLLFAIFQLQNPFSGGSRIEPDAFRWAIERLG
jgi:hypothetical protein